MVIAIIGAGIGGLAAAIRLAHAGHQVTVFDQNPYVGGKLAVIERDGFRFDAGPSLFTQPEYHAELFRLCGERQEDYFQYIKLNEVTRYRWEDGAVVHGWSDPVRLASELGEVLGEDAQAVQAYLRRSREKFAIAGEIFLNNPLQKLSTYTNRKVAWAFARLHRLQMFRNLHALNTGTFRDPRTVQLFDRFATYNGSDPYQASALFSMIPNFEHGEGAYYPIEGMGSIATSLEGLARRQGVQFRLGERVEEVLVGGKRIVGIRTGGEVVRCNALVSNLDVNTFYRNLMPARAPRPERALNQPLSTSAMVFYWGIGAEFPELILHNLFFSRDYRQEFRQLFEEESIPDDPTIYVNITGKHTPADAPPGCENWFVMVNLPPRLALSDTESVAKVRRIVFDKLSRMLGRSIEPLIRTQDVLTPRLLQERTGAWQGAIYGSNSNRLMSGFWRHPNQSDFFANLYFAGGTVHPGGGIPLALKSGQIVAKLLI